MNKMEEMNSAILAATTPIVQIWMNWMMIIFLASVFFVWNHKSARFILAALFLSAPIALFIFKTTNNVHLIGITHLLVWIPLIVYLYFSEIKDKLTQLKSIYGVYLVLFLSTILISLVFDVRDITLVAMGLK